MQPNLLWCPAQNDLQLIRSSVEFLQETVQYKEYSTFVQYAENRLSGERRSSQFWQFLTFGQNVAFKANFQQTGVESCSFRVRAFIYEHNAIDK